MKKLFKKLIDILVLLKSKNYLIYIPVSKDGNAGKLENIDNIHVINYDIDMRLVLNIWNWHVNYITNGEMELDVRKKDKAKKDRN